MWISRRVRSPLSPRQAAIRPPLHRRPSALADKLLAVYHDTAPQIALHYGAADAAQFFLVKRE
jgi:hypothetical protein